jgi:hypothetical protein
MKAAVLHIFYLCKVMQEFFYTILAAWVIWKLFDAFSSKGRNTTYQQNTHHHYYQQKKEEGAVRVETKKKPAPHIPATEGEYVDFEDVK